MPAERFQIFFVGTYSEKGPYIPYANGEGILTCSLNLESGEIQQICINKDVINATYLAKDSKGNLFAACDYFEKTGEIQAFRIEEGNKLEKLSVSSSYGQSTCHLRVDQKGERIFGASYGDGKISMHSFENGHLQREPQILSFEGNGPNKERQEAAHIHQVEIYPNGQWIYACDLGSDAIWQLQLAENNEELQVVSKISTPSGSGPRHLVFYPNKPFAYVFCELDAKILTYTVDEHSGNMNLSGSISSLPKDFTGVPAGAAIKIHPSLKTLYVSNRNHNSFSVFTINNAGGELSFKSNFSSEGLEPRDFSINPTGNWLLAANQDSDTLIPFRLDTKTGLPDGTKGTSFECGTPVCILFK
ncbi:lactonase family protein [Gramella sp. AN32]|uniref:Lactonase family protein n=1 Tax=Christiangramia antarctica TaxID=2058158 RepID=A0ABW5XDC8_9FLAO|nr:lactonase family protein [Gramella sp. AN32]MCM4157575.1 hypothetical protein [Gramella sp. AN32]